MNHRARAVPLLARLKVELDRVDPKDSWGQLELRTQGCRDKPVGVVTVWEFIFATGAGCCTIDSEWSTRPNTIRT
jgi:hypothetical protein